MRLILISSGQEWRAVKSLMIPVRLEQSPYGDFFTIAGNVFLHGGWGKVDAAGSCQYAIDRFAPTRVLNLGTCGGIAGLVELGDLVIGRSTVIYDILEAMSDPHAAIDHYRSPLVIDDELKTCFPDAKELDMFSADRDLRAEDIPMLKNMGATVVDWESGAIARVCHRNGVLCSIVRGVSDLLATDNAPGDNGEQYVQNTPSIMAKMLQPMFGEIVGFGS